MVGLLFFLPLYFFGFITHSFVPYLQLMKKNKEKEYFMWPVIHSPQSSFSSLIVVPFSVACLDLTPFDASTKGFCDVEIVL